MPRRSSASLAVPSPSPGRHPVLPPAGLSAPEGALFRSLVASVRADHFTSADAPLLAAYCTAAVLERQAAAALAANGAVQGDRPSPWLKVHETQAKLLALLATRLRLCASSRIDARHAGRTAKAGTAPGVDWDAHFSRTENK